MQQTLQDAGQEYIKTRKKARQQYFISVAQGRSGFIPSLDGVLQNATIVSEIDIGIHDIPLKKIVGTMSHSRALMFAEGFLPLAKPNTEFYAKWITLFHAHMEEGIRDPLRVHEYLNWFYVIEGNKRVSVLKYLNAYSARAHVIRLLPKKNPKDRTIETYYDFVEFNRRTGIFTIWIKKPGGFITLIRHLEKYDPPLGVYPDKYRLFYSSVYTPFRELFYEAGGKQLPCTTGDALLEFIEIYGIPKKITPSRHRNIIQGLIVEMKAGQGEGSYAVGAEPMDEPRETIVSSISGILSHPKPLKVAFIHAGSPDTSGWARAHEEGRGYVQEKLQGRIETFSFPGVPEDETAYSIISEVAKDHDVVFTTSPLFLNATLKVALQFPETRFFNCNRKWTYKHVRTYFGRSYEVRFLLGVIAGALSRADTIGFIGGIENPESRASVNAFALGVKAVNPYARVLLEWTGKWDDPGQSRVCAHALCALGADIISQNVLPPPGDTSGMYGLYGITEKKDCGEYSGVHYAHGIWKWGVFYKRILKNVLSNTLKTARNWTDQKSTPVNFWWGIDSRILDIEYTREHIPAQVYNMVENLKRMIMHNEITPFQGPITDQSGNLRVSEGESASYRDMLEQTWFVDNITPGKTSNEGTVKDHDVSSGSST